MKPYKLFGYIIVFTLIVISIYFILSSFNIVPYVINNQEIIIIDIILIGFLLFVILKGISVLETGYTVPHGSGLNVNVNDELIDSRFLENHGFLESPNIYIGLQNFFKESRDFKDLMDRLLIAASKITRSNRGSILLYNKKSGKLNIFRTIGWEKSKLSIAKEVEITPGEGIAGRVFLNENPLIMNNLSQLEGFEPKENYKSDAFASLPISSLSHTIGVLNLTEKDDEKFSEKEINILKFICNEAAVYSTLFLKELC